MNPTPEDRPEPPEKPLKLGYVASTAISSTLILTGVAMATEKPAFVLIGMGIALAILTIVFAVTNPSKP